MTVHEPFKIGKRDRRGHVGRVYVPIDPEYTLSARVIMALFGWSIGTLRKKQAREGFPAPKHFDQKCVRWHPQQINDWLKDGGQV